MSEYPTYLIHYGIPGQKWGVRRFQNEDGTYTSDGLERRRQLEQKGAFRHEIRKAGREGKEEAKYNKALARSQNAANKKFDKYSSKLEKQISKGLNPSERIIRKAIKYGTEVRKADYIARDPQLYYDEIRSNRKAASTAALAGGVLFGVGSGVASGLLTSVINSQISKRNLDRYYKDVFEKAKNETITDLKKHGIIKNNTNNTNKLSKAGNMALKYAQTNRNKPLLNKIERENPGSTKNKNRK